MTDSRPYSYLWPQTDLSISSRWQTAGRDGALIRGMPESIEELASDSRWPAFFPSPICIVTTTDGRSIALEKVVGPSIVNRFPYIVALSFCTQDLSERHHVRRVFTEILENSGSVALQFIPRGPALDSVMGVITTIPESQTGTRIARSGLPVRKALTNSAPVFSSAYLVYEATLVNPCKDFGGQAIYPVPWKDVGSHRVYFLEINAIQLRQDIVEGRSQILWRSLPVWEPKFELQQAPSVEAGQVQDGRYQKGYTPHYAFPSSGTIAFESDEMSDGMAVKHLPPLPEDQLEVDNDRARWPCFFPSSLGMITTWAPEGYPNLMPCGSTTVVSRHPLVIATCVSYAQINERYAPRATLDIIQRSGRFSCGVPFINDQVISAVQYSGNVSFNHDRDKVAHSGLQVVEDEWAPVLPALPLQFDCQVVDQVPLGTHIMFLGEVRRIRVRGDLTPDNPIEWCPWADILPVEGRRNGPGGGEE